MALFPSVFPWTLVLTQVMTAGLAVVPGRWAHLFRKMPAGTGVLWVGESRGPRRLGYHIQLGLALWEEKKNPFALVKKPRTKARTIRGLLQTCSLNMHTLTHSAKICMVGWSRSIQSWFWHTANSNGYHTKDLEQAPRLRKKEKTHNTAFTQLSWKCL